MRLAHLPVETVRRRIVVSEADPVLFSGTLRKGLDPWGRAEDDEAIHSAVAIANAEDVIEALPDGLETTIDERGRSFSGGQRQRLVLARALLSDAELLVLVEPTSAVDAHTEARIAKRLRVARSRQDDRHRHDAAHSCSTRPTESSSSKTGKSSTEGTHRELLKSSRAYNWTVTRGEDL